MRSKHDKSLMAFWIRVVLKKGLAVPFEQSAFVVTSWNFSFRFFYMHSKLPISITFPQSCASKYPAPVFRAGANDTQSVYTDTREATHAVTC